MGDERGLTTLSVAELAERLAASDPVPGGGSAAALTGALGAALVGMVAELTAGRSEYAAGSDEVREIALAATAMRSELLQLAELDARAYRAVVEARRLPKATELERNARAAQVAAATRDATRVPLRTAERAAEVLRLAQRIAPIGNRHAVSDAGAAALLAAAAARAALLNVRINLPHLSSDEPLRREAADGVERVLAGLGPAESSAMAAVEERLR